MTAVANDIFKRVFSGQRFCWVKPAQGGRNGSGNDVGRCQQHRNCDCLGNGARCRRSLTARGRMPTQQPACLECTSSHSCRLRRYLDRTAVVQIDFHRRDLQATRGVFLGVTTSRNLALWSLRYLIIPAMLPNVRHLEGLLVASCSER